MLKGKAKIDFENWYKQKYLLSVEGDCDSCGCGIGLPFEYDRLPQTMQQGVLREFFESKGIIITLDRMKYEKENGVKFYYEIYDENTNIKLSPYISLDYSTAFTHAIYKACEIYNGKKN